MSQSDWLFLTMIAIGVATLTVIVVQVVRSRRGKDDGGNWWEGPWDQGDDRR